MTTWRQEFEAERAHAAYFQPEQADDSSIVAVAPDEAAMDVEFDGGFGGAEGPYILIWTEQRVYFPVVYDGAESLGSAPRNPQSTGQRHVGGG